MAGLIRKRHTQSEKPEDVKCLEKLKKLKHQFNDINLEVQNAARSNNMGLLLRVFDRALINVPKISRKLEGVSPKGEQLRDACAIFSEGLNSYLMACQHYKKSIVEDSEHDYARANTHMSDAGQLIKEAVKLFQ